MSQRICPICQTKTAEKSRYCPTCGSQLSEMTSAQPIMRPSLWPVIPLMVIFLLLGLFLVSSLRHDDWVFAVQEIVMPEDLNRPFGRVVEAAMPGARWKSYPVDDSRARVIIQGRLADRPELLEIELMVIKNPNSSGMKILRSGVFQDGIPLSSVDTDKFFQDLFAFDPLDEGRPEKSMRAQSPGP
jgi:endogenous inhibitor of DNA gyrase (YacG/DUF329 family)